MCAVAPCKPFHLAVTSLWIHSTCMIGLAVHACLTVRVSSPRGHLTIIDQLTLGRRSQRPLTARPFISSATYPQWLSAARRVTGVWPYCRSACGPMLKSPGRTTRTHGHDWWCTSSHILPAAACVHVRQSTRAHKMFSQPMLITIKPEHALV